MIISLSAFAQEQPKTEAPKWQGKFEQLDQTLPTPNEYRSGSGSPGPKYWQQQADYDMAVELNDQLVDLVGNQEKFVAPYFNRTTRRPSELATHNLILGVGYVLDVCVNEPTVLRRPLGGGSGR